MPLRREVKLPQWSSILHILVCHLLIPAQATKTAYFNNLGDCQRDHFKPFDLADHDISLGPVGREFVAENLRCNMTFRAPLDYGVCLTFEDFEITDCRVRLKILYSTDSNTWKTWRQLECGDSKPSNMCTAERYVTVEVAKEKLIYNLGYKFKISVHKSKSITEEGVLFASIGVFVGVILGVVALTAILAVSVIYCCCKHKGSLVKKSAESGERASQEGRHLVQPSAPPIDIEDHHWIAGTGTPYGPYMPGHLPPPYIPPPPYQLDDEVTIQQTPDPAEDTDQTYPVKT